MPKALSESKSQRFERIAERRVNEAVRVLRLLGNLADKKNYEYSDAHVQQLFNAIDYEVRQMKARYRADSEQNTKQFKFRGA